MEKMDVGMLFTVRAGRSQTLCLTQCELYHDPVLALLLSAPKMAFSRACTRLCRFAGKLNPGYCQTKSANFSALTLPLLIKEHTTCVRFAHLAQTPVPMSAASSSRHVVKPPPFRCHCAAEFSSCATSEPAQGTFHRPAGGRHLSAARRLPAIPDRPAFPSMAHPRAA